MVTGDGRVKVLDFGLAQRRIDLPADPKDSNTPTRARTIAGAVVGTIQYMSPEQAEGKPVDERTDIFSLGVIFYEMLSGRVPFEGDSALGVLSAILQASPPPLSEFRPDAVPTLSYVVDRCLAKDPSERYPEAVDLEAMLKAARDQPSSVNAVPAHAATASVAAGQRKLSCTLSLAIGLTTASMILLALLVPWRSLRTGQSPTVTLPDVLDAQITEAERLFAEKRYGEAEAVLDSVSRESSLNTRALTLREEIGETRERVQLRLARIQELIDAKELNSAAADLDAVADLAPYNPEVVGMRVTLDRSFRDEVSVASRAIGRTKSQGSPGAAAAPRATTVPEVSVTTSSGRAMPREETLVLGPVESEIAEALEKYERALEEKNIELFRQAKPNLGDGEEKRLQDSFAATDSHAVGAHDTGDHGSRG